MGKNQHEPYEALGSRLKFLREQWQQSVSEVSGTLEIDEKTLRAIEAGKTIPSESMLDMFISHFLLTDDQAEDLRGLVQQYQDQAVEGISHNLEDMLMKQIVMCLPGDSRIVYTDSMQATVNKNGVVLQFMQGANNPNGQQPGIVSRLGMSRDHAEKMIEVLRATLDQHNRSQSGSSLPPSKKDRRSKD